MKKEASGYTRFMNDVQALGLDHQTQTRLYELGYVLTCRAQDEARGYEIKPDEHYQELGVLSDPVLRKV